MRAQIQSVNSIWHLFLWIVMAPALGTLGGTATAQSFVGGAIAPPDRMIIGPCGVDDALIMELRAQQGFMPPTDCDLSNTNPSEEYAPGNVLYRIPCVVHVLRDTDGTGDVTPEEIHEKIRLLNQYFDGNNRTDDCGRIDSNIDFFLATTDPDGLPTEGITYSNNSQWALDTYAYTDETRYFETLAWDPSRYLNIYINNLQYPDRPGVVGYATFPFRPSLNTVEDRVVLKRGPGPSDLLAHEVGHYLGLLHTFTGGCNEGLDCATSGDTICDTPNQNSTASGCVTTACSGETVGDNVMDYSRCSLGFTSDQVRRMRCVLASYRQDLYEQRTISQVHPGDDIQAAIDAAEDGDVIQIMAGRHLIAAPLTTSGKSITIKGQLGTDCTRLSILDGNGESRILSVTGGEGSETVFRDLAFEGGTADRGGAILLDQSSPWINFCTFSDNSAAVDGGAISMEQSSPRVSTCTFTGNSAVEDGGAIHVFGGHPKILDSTFTVNAARSGGGIRLEDSFGEQIVIRYCALVNNTATVDGGGIASSYANLYIYATEVSGNSAGNLGGGMHLAGDSSTIISIGSAKICGNTPDQTFPALQSGPDLGCISACCLDCGLNRDSDEDGVPDCEDQCPGAPDLDSDDDGVPDCIDQCPGSPDVDSDDDGVLDCADQCPGSPDVDSDDDGVLDCADQCPGSPDVDSDDDGVLDCADQCPGSPDVDSDDDGVLDCADQCPGSPDVDSDDDGILDCADPCPLWSGACAGAGDLTVSPGQDIQAAIDAVTLGGIVRIEEGVHVIPATLRTTGRKLTIEGSSASTSYPWAPDTFITGSGVRQIMDIKAVATGELVIRNITFFRGNSDLGGGVGIQSGAAPRFERCWFMDNQARMGAGVAVRDSGDPIFRECVFYRNTATGSGGGCWSGPRSHSRLERCTFLTNTAALGAGMYLDRGSATLSRTGFSGNSGAVGGGALLGNLSSIRFTDRSFAVNNTSSMGAGVWLIGNGRETSEFNGATISGHNTQGLLLTGGATPDINYSTITLNLIGVHAADGRPWIGRTKICSNQLYQTLGGYRWDFWAPNCIGSVCNLFLDLACLPLFPLTDTDIDSPPGPLLNGSFDKGEEGLGGWVRINNAHGIAATGADLQELPVEFHTSVKLFGSDWGMENVSGVSQNICWEPGVPISYGADYIVPECEPLLGITEDGEFLPSSNHAYVALRIYRLDEAGEDDLWYEVPTGTVDGTNMQPGMPGSMSNTYVIPEEEASQISRVEFALLFRQYDNFDRGSVYFTNAHAEVECRRSCPADHNGNGEVDSEDLSRLLAAWGTSDTSLDLDGDGQVGAGDLAVLMDGWGDCSG